MQRCLDEWKQGYTPSEWAKRVFRSRFRAEVEMALARLICVVDGGGDDLSVLPSVQSFAEHIGRLDAQLRRDLAGDRWRDTGRAGEEPPTRN